MNFKLNFCITVFVVNVRKQYALKFMLTRFNKEVGFSVVFSKILQL